MDTPSRISTWSRRMAMRTLAGLSCLAATLLCVPASSYDDFYGPLNNSTSCNTPVIGDDPFQTGILEESQRVAKERVPNSSPTAVTGSDAGETIDLSWTNPGGIPNGWYTEICVEKEAYVLNRSEEECTDIVSGGSTTSASVSQCFGDSCSYRDVWYIRIRLRTNCGEGTYTQYSDQISVQTE